MLGQPYKAWGLKQDGECDIWGIDQINRLRLMETGFPFVREGSYK